MNYAVACPVCRREHVIEADFLSSPRTTLATSGRRLPAASCGVHSAAELRAVYAVTATDALVARSDADALDALKRALDR